MELVKCHEFPHREQQYTVQVCPTSYKVWSEQRHERELKWEWKFEHLKNIHWYDHLNKLEVETQR